MIHPKDFKFTVTYSTTYLFAGSNPQCLLETQPLQEVDEDMVAEVDLSTSVSDEEREEMQVELDKLEEEISTLRQVLAAKEKHHAELKQKLGVNPLSEFRHNFNKSWHEMQTSTAFVVQGSMDDPGLACSKEVCQQQRFKPNQKFWLQFRKF
ncbi:UNVERIFIED_CONTAM: hypothetical protein FKN15_002324 [Acipenser sinensis]